MTRTICYRVKATGQSYLCYYTRGTLTEAQARAERINADKPQRLFNGELAKCDEREYFADEQELFN